MNPVTAKLPTKYGAFMIKVWPAPKGQEPVALVAKDFDSAKTPLVRIHSECLTGDTFGSVKCDCQEQKDAALSLIQKSGNGVFIYLRQEGRGIGLYEKIKAYSLQEQGYDTHQANLALGHKADAREYSSLKMILDELGVKELELLTNNPDKVAEVEKAGFKVTKRIPLISKSNKHNKEYLEVKKDKFKHII